MSTNSAHRSIVARETWVNDVAAHLTITAMDGFDMYVGILPLSKRKETLDLSRFDEIVQNFRHIPRKHIYPEFDDSLTLFNPELFHGDVFLKAPSVSSYRDTSGDQIATTLLEEARVNEIISCHPHPNLGVYLGCVVDDGRVVRLAFRKYDGIISDPAERPH